MSLCRYNQLADIRAIKPGTRIAYCDREAIVERVESIDNLCKFGGVRLHLDRRWPHNPHAYEDIDIWNAYLVTILAAGGDV